MDADKLAGWVEGHKVPAAAIGGVALAGVFAVVQKIRNKSAAPAAAANTGTYFVVPGGGLDGYSTSPSLDSPYIPKQPDPTAPDTGGSSTPIKSSAPGQAIYQAPKQATPAPPPTINPLSLFQPPAPSGVPLALPQIDPGAIFKTYEVSNPVGYTDSQVAVNSGSYAPSLSDYATERPGGITRALVSTGGPAGASYTIDNTNFGSGPVRDTAYRNSHPGERYDQYGRIIA